MQRWEWRCFSMPQTDTEYDLSVGLWLEHKMKTVVLEQPGVFSLVDTVEPPPPSRGEVLLAIKRIGICGTDLHAFAGRQPFFSYPRILGHELGAIVQTCGPGVSTVHPGDHVAVEPYLTCGACGPCRVGRYNCCVLLQCLGVHTDGGMRERLVVPADRLYKSDRLTLDQLALVETLGIGAHAVQRAQLEAGEWTAIIGVGPIGVGVLQMALAQGANVIAVDLAESRLRFAVKQGVHATIDARKYDVGAALADLTAGAMPACVFDATGSVKSMEASVELVGAGGRLVLVGLAQARISFDDPSFHRREITILASRNSNNAFPYLIRLLEEGSVDVNPWITHRLDLAEVPERFAAFADPATGALKAVIAVGD